MEMPQEEEAWGEFKSTTGQGDSFGGTPAMEGSGEDGHREKEPSSAAHHQPEAGEAEPEPGGGKEDSKFGPGTLLAPAGLAAPQQSAAEQQEERNEFKTAATAAAAAAVVAAAEPEEPRRCGDDGDGTVDLLNLLPSPTTAGAAAGSGSDGGGGGGDMDLFGSMLASPPAHPITEITGVGDAAAADAGDGLRGVGGKEQPEEEEWGVFEQPGPPAETDWSGDGGSPPPAATPPHAAEKVDGEWIDLLESGSDLPEEKNEGIGSVGGDDGDGAEQTLAVSDSGMAAVGRMEHEPEPRLDSPVPEPEQQQQLGDYDSYSESRSVSLMENLGRNNGGGGGGGTTGTLLGDSSKCSSDDKPTDKSGGGPERSCEEIGSPRDGPHEKTPQEQASLATAPTQSSDSETPGDVAGSMAKSAVYAGEVFQFEPPLPAAAAVETATPSEGGSDGGSLLSIGKNGGSGAKPEVPGAAAADIVDWGGFGDPTPDVEAAPPGGLSAVSSGSAYGDEDKEAGGKGEKDQGGDEWSSFEALPTPSPPQDEHPFESLSQPAADPAEGGVDGDSKDGWPPAPGQEAEEPVGSPASASGNAGGGAGGRSKEVAGAAVAPAAATTGRGGVEQEGSSCESPASGPDGGEERPFGDDGEEPSAVVPGLEAVDGDRAGQGSSGWGAFDKAPPAATADSAAPAEGASDGANLLSIGEDGGTSAVPGATAADTADWGDFGNLEGVAAAPSASAHGDEDKEVEEEGEKEHGDDEWSAFEALPTPSPPRDEHPFETQPQPAADPTEGGVEGQETEEPLGSPASASGDVDDRAGGENQEPFGATVASAAATGEGGGSESSEEKSPAEGADGGEERPVGVDREESPTAVPDMEAAGGDSEGEGSSSWGAFDEAPPAAAAATSSAAVAAVPAAVAAVGGETELERADEDVPRAAEVPPDTTTRVVAEAEVVVEEETNSGGGQEPESEDEWGSDFGDFEEAPTPEEPESGVSGAASSTAPPKIAAFPAPPAADVRSPPAAAVAAGGASGAAVAGGETRDAAASASSRQAHVAAEGAKESPSLLAVMVTVFDAAFGPEGAAGPTATPRNVLPVSGTSRGGVEERSIDSLADLAHLLRHAEPPPSRPRTRLNRWARLCILRGIRPVPDALPLGDGDGDESDQQGTGRRSRRRSGKCGGGTSFKAEPSTPAVSSPRALPVGGGGSDRTAAAAAAVQSAALPTAPLAASSSRSASASRPKASAATALPPAEAAPGQESAGPEKDDAAKGGGDVSLEAGTTVSTPAAAAEVNDGDTTYFASFPAPAVHGPSGEDGAAAPASSDEDGFVWSEASAAMTPEMPRHPPPRMTLTPSAADVANRSSQGSGDNGVGNSDGAVNAAAPTGFGAIADVDVGGGGGGGGGGDDDDGEWSDDPFDSFQSAPPASPPAPPLAPPKPPPPLLETSPFAAPAAAPTTAAATADRASSPSPPVEMSPWNLDFLMAAPAKGGGAEGRLSPVPGAASAEGGSSGNSLDLVSQALAGFGIASSAATPDAPRPPPPQDGQGDLFSAFSVGGGGGTFVAGGGAEKGERDRVASVDVSELLRATRLRGGGRRASRPAEALSSAAETRLAALPDLSYMLSQRIRFPMRAAEQPMIASAAAAAAVVPSDGLL